PDGYRRWSLCRDELQPGGAAHDRRGRLRGGRISDHPGRSAGSARAGTEPPGRQRRLGGQAQVEHAEGRLTMCGIVGYVGDKSAVGIILEGLKRLEYRGYDSAGVAVLDADGLQVRRAPGRLKAL